jgi:hypothetical protein
MTDASRRSVSNDQTGCLGWTALEQLNLRHGWRLWTILEMVPRRGLEPPRPCGHQHLKLACLPISPPGHFEKLSLQKITILSIKLALRARPICRYRHPAFRGTCASCTSHTWAFLTGTYFNLLKNCVLIPRHAARGRYRHPA